MKIEVTEQDIHEGVRMDCDRCPIAHALSRAFPHKMIRVGSSCAQIGMDRVNLPTEATDFIAHFDADAGAFPFTFNLDL